ncbi:hypothetical protein ACKP2L_03205 [Oenococcus alcoholitolerans]|uniref:hypothetical protein n=1 Tax=Oenococcus alcoholitolerans TaxID=931074 RepID=UPI003F71D127
MLKFIITIKENFKLLKEIFAGISKLNKESNALKNQLPRISNDLNQKQLKIKRNQELLERDLAELKQALNNK